MLYFRSTDFSRSCCISVVPTLVGPSYSIKPSRSKPTAGLHRNLSSIFHFDFSFRFAKVGGLVCGDNGTFSTQGIFQHHLPPTGLFLSAGCIARWIPSWVHNGLLSEGPKPETSGLLYLFRDVPLFFLTRSKLSDGRGGGFILRGHLLVLDCGII